MATCAKFAEFTGSHSRKLAALDSDDAASGDPVPLDKLMQNIQDFEDYFSRHLKILLDALNYLAATETVVFLSLCARLSMAKEGMADVVADR